MSVLSRIKKNQEQTTKREASPEQAEGRKPVSVSALKERLKKANPTAQSLPMVKTGCTCVIEVEECETFASQDPKKKGAEFFKLVYVVKETTDPEHVRVGGRYVWLNENTNQYDGADRMLNFCIAASGVDPDEFEIPSDEDEFNEFFEEIEKIWGPDQEAKGVSMIMETTLSRGGFPKASFAPIA